MGRGQYFDHFKTSEDIFNEMRVASKGGTADYYGMTYEKIEKNLGIFWPCPELDHPGTPRLFEDLKFYTNDGKAQFHPITHRPSAEEPDEEYPVILTTGRVVSQYLSGTQTRRIGGLVDLCPEPYVEIHPTLAEQHGIVDGEWMIVESRRGQVRLKAKVVTTIRPDTVFIPYHWASEKSANLLTIRAYDPISKIPEYKKAAVRVSKAA
jgi:assimilatory nitrate reductase catalytic subunit